MPIASFAELKGAIASWLARDDLTASIPDFIALFEATANRRLRVRQMQTAASLAPSAGEAALPNDYLAWRRVTWNGNRPRELDYVHPSYLQAAFPDAAAGIPRLFSIEGATLRIRPADEAALELAYFQKIPALSDAAPVNWLLTAHPDLYLFGALTEAQGFNVDPEKMATWGSRRNDIFEEIERLDARTRGAGAVRVMGTVV
jgi:hypothetical protein